MASSIPRNSPARNFRPWSASPRIGLTLAPPRSKPLRTAKRRGRVRRTARPLTTKWPNTVAPSASSCSTNPSPARRSSRTTLLRWRDFRDFRSRQVRVAAARHLSDASRIGARRARTKSAGTWRHRLLSIARDHQRQALSAARDGCRRKTAACVSNGLPDEQSEQVLETAMKVTYDATVDVLRVILRDVPVEESDEDKPGVILDYDAEGNMV